MPARSEEQTLPMRQSLEQKRAKAAWNATAANPSKEYLSLVRGTTATILSCGLGQTLAFYLAKNEKEHRDLTNNLAAWLLRSGDEPNQSKRGKDLMEAIIGNTSETYRRYSSEALAYLQWLKRFAEAKARTVEEEQPSGGKKA